MLWPSICSSFCAERVSSLGNMFSRVLHDILHYKSSNLFFLFLSSKNIKSMEYAWAGKWHWLYTYTNVPSSHYYIVILIKAFISNAEGLIVSIYSSWPYQQHCIYPTTWQLLQNIFYLCCDVGPLIAVSIFEIHVNNDKHLKTSHFLQSIRDFNIWSPSALL